MLKSELLSALQQEIIRRHDFSTFIDESPSIAQGGKGVCVPGCPACRKTIQTMNGVIEHLAVDVLPKVIGRFEGVIVASRLLLTWRTGIG